MEEVALERYIEEDIESKFRSLKNLDGSANKYINMKRVQTLVDLFSEFDKFSEFKSLFNSAETMFYEILLQKDQFFSSEELANTKLHLLKNKFNNLGMEHSIEILNEIKKLIPYGMDAYCARDRLLYLLEKSVETSFDIISEKYFD